jgi:hypothetical protein
MARKVAAQGIDMLPADRWESQHNLAFQLYLGMQIGLIDCAGQR